MVAETAVLAPLERGPLHARGPAKRPTPTGGAGKPRWNARKEAFVENVLKGKDGATAAKEAGYASK
jgi:hypothetical protein